MELVNLINWGGSVLAEVSLNRDDNICENLLKEFFYNKEKVNMSHKIGGRFENQYLKIDDIPSARSPMRIARDLGKNKLGISSLILFEAPPGSPNPHPPFWFNVAAEGEMTGLHDHAHLATLSGVLYLQAQEECCGDLYFRKEGLADLIIKPEVGKMVIFPPFLRHGVHPNLSVNERISFAFNLFPFPLIQDNL